MTVKKLKELLSGFDDDLDVRILAHDLNESISVYAIELDLDEKALIFK